MLSSRVAQFLRLSSVVPAVNQAARAIRVHPQCILRQKLVASPVATLGRSRFLQARYLCSQAPAEKEDDNDKGSILDTLSPEKHKELRKLQMEYDVEQASGYNVPQHMSDAMWLRIMECPSRSQRMKMYHYFSKTEKRKMKKKEMQIERHKELAKVVDSEGFFREPMNTIFQFIRESTMSKFYNNNVARAMIFGQEIVLDLGYESHMKEREIINLCRQFWQLYGANRKSPDPFHIVLCNAQPDSPTLKHLKRTSSIESFDHILVTVTEKCYTERFEKDKLVYLTPDAPNALKKFDHDAVYIVGGLVDKSIIKPVSMAKAKRQGIKMAKLPLDRYFK